MEPIAHRQVTFWNARSASFAGAREPAALEHLAERLAILPEAARPARGRRILEVGAGTGSFALWAADAGASVTAIDISPDMLARLSAEDRDGAVETLCLDWANVDPDARGWRRRFDVVFAQMVPGFREVADFERFEACSRGWCVFIGWGRLRRDPWLEAAFAAHGVDWIVPPGVPLALDRLASIGRRPEPVWRGETRARRRSVDEAIRTAIDHLAVRGVTADRERLAEIAAAMAEDGVIAQRSASEIGILWWRP